ncbi:hypothetical protein PILCRDRAFT_93641 [Piloderma croceum F 1598]|uniref:Uncharacterized protein n=1 Tax=Piloderma croceum (strain F 1598) TaxID=765440 RepID=A0A0C3EVX3_PILCF|nr:hypothetical protein PILCRDRAFT_93641 [Piloderma croceum F 1598]
MPHLRGQNTDSHLKRLWQIVGITFLAGCDKVLLADLVFRHAIMDCALPHMQEWKYGFYGLTSSSSACLIAQQCELVITGQRLILKIYLPFLWPNYTSATCNTNHQAAVGTINTTHAIIYASRVLHAICRQSPGSRSIQPGPAIFDYYSFRQALFDATVVCAHLVIMQPGAIWARVALDDVANALEVMKDPVVATGRGFIQGCVEGCISEPVKIIEMLKKKADGVRAGLKRKHSEVDTHTDHLAGGFQLPYVGIAVTLARPATGSSPGSMKTKNKKDNWINYLQLSGDAKTKLDGLILYTHNLSGMLWRGWIIAYNERNSIL